MFILILLLIGLVIAFVKGSNTATAKARAAQLAGRATPKQLKRMERIERFNAARLQRREDHTFQPPPPPRESIVGIYPGPPPPPPRPRRSGKILLWGLGSIGGFVVLIIVVGIMAPQPHPVAASEISNVEPVKAPQPVTSSPVASSSSKAVSGASVRQSIASDFEDRMRTLGHSDQIYAVGADATELVFSSDDYSDDQGRQIFLSVTLPGEEASLCSVGFDTVTLKSGMLSLGHSYSLHCSSR